MRVIFDTTNRKDLVAAIAEVTGFEKKYLGVPKCNYQVGPFIIDKNCELTCDDKELSILELTIERLAENHGFHGMIEEFPEEKAQQEEEKHQAEQEKNRKNTPPEVQEVLNKGNEFLDKIHRSNDAIPGEEISAKISRMELIVEKIFERAQKHPEIIPDLKKLMNYYLPMTVKLLDAYEEMDQQPVQGENIQASKKEIEDTLDTLNQAFEKLLDSVFQDTAWDVSSDISVLHTLLAQEGLTDDDFAKMKKN